MAGQLRFVDVKAYDEEETEYHIRQVNYSATSSRVVHRCKTTISNLKGENYGK